MNYFVISRGYEDLGSVISKIFEENKEVKVISDRRKDNNKNYSGLERRKVNKVEKIG